MKRIGLITQVNCHMGKDLISCGYISYRGDIVRFYPDEYMGDPLQYHDIVTFEFAPSEGDFEVAEKEKYYVLRKARDDDANRMYLNILEEENDGLYIQDIIRGGISNDHPSIPRNLSK